MFIPRRPPRLPLLFPFSFCLLPSFKIPRIRWPEPVNNLVLFFLCCAIGVVAGGATVSEEDRRSLSLLNKLIGAQILVQCTEPFAAAPAPADAKSSSFEETSEQRSADGSVSCSFLISLISLQLMMD